MEITYKSDKLKKLCTNYELAKKEFNLLVAERLFYTINYIEQAACFADIIDYRPFRFHGLEGKRKGTYAIDLGKKLGFRLIIEPLDKENKSLGKEKDFQVIKQCTSIVLVWEVTNHYE